MTTLIATSGALSFAFAHSAGQGVHECFQIARLVDGRDQHQSILDDDDQAGHAIHHDRAARRVHDVVARLDGVDATLNGVAGIIRWANALERSPRADVVPPEVAWQHDDAITALEDAHVDGNRRDGAEEPADVLRV